MPPTISFLSILSPAQYWVNSTDYSVPYYEVFFTPLLGQLVLQYRELCVQLYLQLYVQYLHYDWAVSCFKILREIERILYKLSYLKKLQDINLTFILLMWTFGRAPNNASKWEMGFN
jgi:hypothetical protein